MRTHTNNYAQTLSSSITDSATSMTVSSAVGLPSISGSDFFHLTLQSGSTIEIVKVTGVASNVLTIVRAQENTTASAFSSGTIVSLRMTADSVDRKQDQTAGSTDVIDFGGASSFEIPNNSAPTVNATGEIALDTTVTDYADGYIKYYSGSTEYGVVAMPNANFASPSDGYVVTYDATTDKFKLAAGSGGGGGASATYTSHVTIGGNATASGYLDLLEDSDNGSNKIRLTPPSAIASDKTITLPDVTGTVYVSSGTDVAVADGGTNISSYTTGDLLYASASGVLSKLGIGNTGQSLNVVAGVPAWSGTTGYFSVGRNSAQTLANATYTKIQWNNEISDVDNTVDTTTNYRHTPLVAGKYLYIAGIGVNPAGAATGGQVYTALYKNGSVVATEVIYSASTSLITIPILSWIIDMNGSTDYVEVYGRQDYGASKDLLAGNQYNFFTGVLLK